MAYSFLILDTYYQDFLKKLRNDNLNLYKKSYQEQRDFLLNQNFGTSDYYSYNLIKLGHPAEDLIVNDETLQRQWAKEHKLKISGSSILDKFQMLPYVHKFLRKPDWIQTIALAQIKDRHPDILYIQDLSILNPGTLKRAKKYTKLLVGQIASPLPSINNLKQFDLILTSFPHYVEKLRRLGVKSEYFKIGFEGRLLKKIGKRKRKYELSFVGGISPSHRKGLKVLNYLAENIKIDVFGYGKGILSPFSKLYKSHHGEVWALEMYKILAESKITINRHIDVSENYANNMRLYEATGMGAMLITDRKDNLNDLFKVGEEIVDYDDPKDLLSKIKYYQENDQERRRIAKAGQLRTLREHTYRLRMKELLNIIDKYV